MSAQTTYSYFSQIGAAGGIIDLAPYAIDTFINEEDNGVMAFGVGVVPGSDPGVTILLPTSDSTAEDFQGITNNNRTTEYDVYGEMAIRNGVSIGIMRYGRIYGRVAADNTPAFGDAVYMITSGDEAGYFTSDSTAGVAIKARFLGTVDANAQIAPIELFNQAQE